MMKLACGNIEAIGPMSVGSLCAMSKPGTCSPLCTPKFGTPSFSPASTNATPMGSVMKNPCA